MTPKPSKKSQKTNYFRLLFIVDKRLFFSNIRQKQRIEMFWSIWSMFAFVFAAIVIQQGVLFLGKELGLIKAK